jgi:hypothetical protein
MPSRQKLGSRCPHISIPLSSEIIDIKKYICIPLLTWNVAPGKKSKNNKRSPNVFSGLETVQDFLIKLDIKPLIRECVRNLDLRVQVHPAELWVSKQRVHIVLEASKSAGAKGDVSKICGFVHPLHPC